MSRSSGGSSAGAGKGVRGGGHHYTGAYTDAAGTRRGKAGWECVHTAIDDATRLAYGRRTPINRLNNLLGTYTKTGR